MIFILFDEQFKLKTGERKIRHENII